MSLETDLVAIIGALCPRVFPDVAPHETASPYVTWQQVGGMASTYIEGTLADRRNALIQVNVWSDTRSSATTLALQIESALANATQFQARPQGALIAAVDDIGNQRGTIQDFDIWANR